ncbi:MAG: hypothetical protein ACKOXF_11975, partial [Chitinophagaceae bacterium]
FLLLPQEGISFFLKKGNKKATTGQNFDYGLPLQSCLLEAAIIKILLTRGLNAQIPFQKKLCIYYFQPFSPTNGTKLKSS